MTRMTLAFGLCAAVLVVGCGAPAMTRFEYGTIKLDVGGRVRPVPAKVASVPSPGILLMDGQPRQVTIEARIVEVQPGQALRDMHLWSGGDLLLRPTVIEDTTKRAEPSNISFGFGTSMSRGSSREGGRGGHPPGCTCRQCRGGGSRSSSSMGTGVGVGFPGFGKTDDRMTSARVIFEVGPQVRLDDAYITIEIEYGREPNGQVLLQPLLLPITVTPDAKTAAEQQRDSSSARVIVRPDNTITLDGLVTDESQVKQKAPALGDIPLLNRLFRSNDTDTERRELIIFITPKIVVQEEE